MGDKYVATVRFRMEGVEAKLYGRIMEGKKEAGLSVPDYIKQILTEYFANKDRLDKQKEIMIQFREEMLSEMKQTFRECFSEHMFFLDTMPIEETVMAKKQDDSIKLPEQSEEIPEGALEFLNDME